jgi:hypothetical protein
MKRLTAAILLALFCLIPSAPLWAAAATQDTCPCCKDGKCCRRMHSKSAGPYFDAGPSCCSGCLRGTPGVRSVEAGLPPAAVSTELVASSADPLSAVQSVAAGSSYLAFLYQRPPPSRV